MQDPPASPPTRHWTRTPTPPVYYYCPTRRTGNAARFDSSCAALVYGASFTVMLKETWTQSEAAPQPFASSKITARHSITCPAGATTIEGRTVI